MNQWTLTRIFPLTVLAITLLLAGCSGLTPRPETSPSHDLPQGQCERTLLPDIYDAESSAWHWLAFSQTSPLLEWAALPASPANPNLAFAWALYFSQPGQSPLLLQLGTGQLQQLKPSLPDALQPIVDLHQNAAQTLLIKHQQGDLQRLILESRIQALQQELQQKQTQIDALTAIESQLSTRNEAPPQEDTP